MTFRRDNIVNLLNLRFVQCYLIHPRKCTGLSGYSHRFHRIDHSVPRRNMPLLFYTVRAWTDFLPRYMLPASMHRVFCRIGPSWRFRSKSRSRCHAYHNTLRKRNQESLDRCLQNYVSNFWSVKYLFRLPKMLDPHPFPSDVVTVVFATGCCPAGQSSQVLSCAFTEKISSSERRTSIDFMMLSDRVK